MKFHSDTTVSSHKKGTNGFLVLRFMVRSNDTLLIIWLRRYLQVAGWAAITISHPSSLTASSSIQHPFWIVTSTVLHSSDYMEKKEEERRCHSSTNTSAASIFYYASLQHKQQGIDTRWWRKKMDVVDTSKEFYQRTPTPTPTPHRKEGMNINYRRKRRRRTNCSIEH